MPYTVESPSPRPPPCLVLKKGSKILSLSSLVDADAGVAHADADVGLSIELGIGGDDTDLPTSRQRIPRVENQVDQGLFHLRRIDQYGAELRLKLRLQGDLGAQQALQHGLELLHGGVERDHAGAEQLSPAEGEKLAGEACRPVPRISDLLDVRAYRVARPKLLQDQVTIAQDSSQQIVEVVRYAARQPAYRLQPVRLLLLLLPLLFGGFTGPLLGDVFQEHDGAGYVSCPGNERDAGHPENPADPGYGFDRQLLIKRALAAAERTRNTPIMRLHRLAAHSPEWGVLQHLPYVLGLLTPDRPARRVGQGHGAFGIHDPDAEWQRIE